MPWMPTPGELEFLRRIPGFQNHTARLERRCFPPLLPVPRIQGRLGEWMRMLKRTSKAAWADERLSYEANDWLMHTMKRACHRPSVTAVHAYEDCSLYQFEEAKRLGKACIYDMPIGYYPAWEAMQAELGQRYTDWLPVGGLPSNRYVRPEQKRREMELADVVLAPSEFVRRTIQDYASKKVELTPYGIDCVDWTPQAEARRRYDQIHFCRSAFCPEGRAAAAGGLEGSGPEQCNSSPSRLLAARQAQAKRTSNGHNLSRSGFAEGTSGTLSHG